MSTNETGRSMVEMLGVLAIAGVITVGGLAGYRTAMHKFRAIGISEAIAAASIYAQSHNVKIDSLADLEEYEEYIPACLQNLKATPDGRVEITVKEDCQNILELVGTSFPKCQWKVKSEDSLSGTYNPMGSQKCDTNGCNGCEDD